jgi:hypothetical protein
MKTLLLFATTILSFALVHGQATPILAGDTAPGFYRATYVPVYTLHDSIQDRYPANTDQVVAIDLDGDGVNDLSVLSRYYEMPTSGPTTYWYPNWVSELRMDSTIDVVAVEDLPWIADTVQLGVPIRPSSFWTNSSSMLLAQNTNNYSFRDTWKDQSDHYVGLRVRKASGDTLYAWLKVSVEGHHIVHLEEHACQSSNPRDTVITLQTSISENVALSTVTVFPNPSSSQISLRTSEPLRNAAITVFNSLGQNVRQEQNLFGQEVILDRAGLLPGQYFLQLTDGDRLVTIQKLILVDD